MYRLFIVFMCLISSMYSIENDRLSESSTHYSSDFFSELIQKHQNKQDNGSYLVSMEVYAPLNSTSKELMRCEQIIWEGNPAGGEYRIRARIITDLENHHQCWYSYEYDQDGICKNIILQEEEYSKDQTTHIEFVFDETFESLDIDQEEIFDESTMRLFSIKHLLHSFKDDAVHAHSNIAEIDGHVIALRYASLYEIKPSSEEISVIAGDDEMHILPIDDEMHILPIEEKTSDVPASPTNHSGVGITFGNFLAKSEEVRKGLSYSNYIKDEWDWGLHQFFGQTFLKLFGYYRPEVASGTFGSEHELEDVRITLINGILNITEDLNLNLHQLSSSHGGARIHYVFRHTQGWMSDVTSCAKVKAGFTSPQAKLLAAKWKELIQELGGVGSSGKVLHYAHSIGGSDTYAAKKLLTPQEQKMIHVTTIGSPTMIPNEGFGSVVNYASKRDGVCMFDPIRYLGKMVFPDSNPETNIVYLGTFLGVPFVEHTLASQSYNDILTILGKQFQKKFVKTGAM